MPVILGQIDTLEVKWTNSKVKSNYENKISIVQTVW